eukprot:CAMPEP_0175815596 /NCGR_PEP_ID=MMETSP0107_2-20121207/6045_1 /TAXON_ID=195067 ORGANISM="Goniomonas pacifica, Strain CCMP1869" /NCGR_SAMPLE_ID=MMETSP0107_2 /ASSEMBLY_ACC=CAM_ASM_000203 /LENGTH=95 /DNA_ID=CAMNT_0017127637 /DNA_START=391 /DNA_END=679 /DNA_ORIENTATION=+
MGRIGTAEAALKPTMHIEHLDVVQIIRRHVGLKKLEHLFNWFHSHHSDIWEELGSSDGESTDVCADVEDDGAGGRVKEADTGVLVHVHLSDAAQC